MSPPVDVVVAADTSIALPLILRSHESHSCHLGDARSPSPVDRSTLAESYAVLTRLPGDGRIAPAMPRG